MLYVVSTCIKYSQDCGSKDCVQIKDYLDIFEELPELSNRWDKILLGKKWAYTGGASYAIYQLIPDVSLLFCSTSMNHQMQLLRCLLTYVPISVAMTLLKLGAKLSPISLIGLADGPLQKYGQICPFYGQGIKFLTHG